MASVLGALSWRWRSQPTPRRSPPRRPRRGRGSPNRVQEPLPCAEARVRGCRGSGRRGELGDDGAAVETDLLAADEAVAEVEDVEDEDVEDSEGHPAAVAE